MEWWQAIILGVVEGLTEYLPVSSTGHLILAAWLLGLGRDPQRWEAAFTFNIVIQAGAILAVVGLYWRRIVQMGRGLAGRDPSGRKLAINLIVAFLPAAVLGPLLAERIETDLHGPWPVVGALFVGAWLMLAVAKSRTLMRQMGRDETSSRAPDATDDAGEPEASGSGSAAGSAGADLDAIDWRVAFLIGFGQCIAMWPGTSRSMMTIVAALMLGLRPRAAAEFSFLLGLLTLTAATVWSARQGGTQMIATFGWANVAMGFLASLASAILAVRWFVGFLNRWGLAPFGWYRLGVAMLLAVLLLLGVLTIPAAIGDATIGE